jgi:hypothetical protein
MNVRIIIVSCRIGEGWYEQVDCLDQRMVSSNDPDSASASVAAE